MMKKIKKYKDESEDEIKRMLIQKEMEQRNIQILSSAFERIPTTTTTLSFEAVGKVEKLLEKLEDDEDVQNVYHNMVLA